MKPKKMKVLETFVAGLIYGDYPVDNLPIKRGVKLQLVAEPENPFDSEAIKLMYKGKKLGYIPRNSTAELHELRENDCPVRCTIKQIAKNNPTHRMVLIIVEADYSIVHAIHDFINQ